MAFDAWSGSVPIDACPFVTRGAFELCPAYEPPAGGRPAGRVERCAHMSPVLAAGQRRSYIRCQLRTGSAQAVDHAS